MKTRSRSTVNVRHAAWVCTTLLGTCMAEDATPAAAAAPAPETAPPAEAKAAAEGESGAKEYKNWIEMSVGAVPLSGDRGALQRRQQVRRGASGGIDDFHFESKVGEKTFFQADGRVVFDNHDYSIKLDLKREDRGYLRFGYKEYRTWYDGSGGFLPQSGSWMALENDVLALDRGELWFEGGLTLPSWPQISFKYARDWRLGDKDSTSWGTIHPGGGGTTRGITPSFWALDEVRDSFQGNLRHTVKEVELGLGLRYDNSRINNSLLLRQWAGEPADTHVNQRTEVKTDMFSVHAFGLSQLHEKVFFSTGFLFSTLDTDLGGSRIYGSDYDVGYNPALANGLGFTELYGGSQASDYTGTLNLMVTPFEAFTVTPSVRVQKQDLDGTSFFTRTGDAFSPDTNLKAENQRELLDVTERLEVRYAGVTNWVFYARGDWTQGSGDLRETGGLDLPTVLPVDRYTEDERSLQKYTAGINWYLHRRASIDLQAYHKERDTHYDHPIDSIPNNNPGDVYPAYFRRQDFNTEDANVRFTWRPLSQLTLVSRYDFQFSRVQTTPDPVSGLSQSEGAKINTHVFAQNVTWIPWSRLYLQAGFNYVASKTDTPADEVTKAVLDAENNYWTATATAGFVVDNKTDLQLNYFYYESNNYEDNSVDGVPYGAGGHEHGVTAGVTRKLRENVRLSLKYGYFAWKDELAGDRNDYDAHMVYSSVQYRF